MACNCTKTRTRLYVWRSADGTRSATYPSKLQAEAKVAKVGGSYSAVVKG